MGPIQRILERFSSRSCWSVWQTGGNGSYGEFLGDLQGSYDGYGGPGSTRFCGLGSTRDGGGLGRLVVGGLGGPWGVAGAGVESSLYRKRKAVRERGRECERENFNFQNDKIILTNVQFTWAILILNWMNL